MKICTLLPLLPLIMLGCRSDKDGGADTQPGVDDSAVDADGDGSASPADCDDEDASVFPGAVELCDGVDNDCDGVVDPEGSEGATDWFIDSDGDGWGADDTSVQACSQPSGYAARGGDCDDGSTAYFPGAREDDCADPNDYNCDGSVGYDDDDGDGFAACEECDDADAAVNPDAEEICDQLDNNCDGQTDEGLSQTWYQDSDADGYGQDGVTTEDCEQPTGYAAEDGDCDDAEAGVNPGAAETCDAVDNNCNGVVDEGLETTWYQDGDGDGYGDSLSTTAACTQPTGYAAAGGDCDDGEAAVYPGNTELCDGLDNDCSGAADDNASDASTWYADRDADGYGDPSVSVVACDAPRHFIAQAGDCDDAEALAWTGAAEACDGVDNDCNGSVDEGVTSAWYLDADGDGYGLDSQSVQACAAPTSAYASSGGDCDDGDSAAYPGATPACDGSDLDCDGLVDSDADGDGYADLSCGGTDCDDGDSSVFPGQGGLCASGTDCLDISDAGLAVGDGLYTIDPDGSGSGVAFEAYCDMTTDGGGWTRVSTILLSGSGCVFNASADGDPAVGGNCTKYSDDTINDIGREKIFRSDIPSYPSTYTHYSDLIRYNGTPGQVVQGDSLAAVQGTPNYTIGYSSWAYFHQENWYNNDRCLGATASTPRLSLEYIPNSGNLYACVGACNAQCPTYIRGVVADVFIR